MLSPSLRSALVTAPLPIRRVSLTSVFVCFFRVPLPKSLILFIMLKFKLLAFITVIMVTGLLPAVAEDWEETEERHSVRATAAADAVRCGQRALSVDGNTTSPICISAGYWVHFRASSGKIKSRRLLSGSTTCIPHPYNIEIRPLCDPPAVPRLPVTFTLSGKQITSRSQTDSSAPFLLWGRAGAPLRLKSPRKLPNGEYGLTSNFNRCYFQFTQACP
jgi:hypothetical protein